MTTPPAPVPPTFDSKIRDILTSKKFWATVASVAVIWVGFHQQAMPLAQAVQDTIAAVAAYVIAVGIQDNGIAQK